MKEQKSDGRQLKSIMRIGTVYNISMSKSKEVSWIKILLLVKNVSSLLRKIS